jgi:hypothetical protein
MAHQAQQRFVQAVKTRFPDAFRNADVLDIGSLDVNGNNRDYFTDCRYTGCDVVKGANVDLVLPAHAIEGREVYDTIISTEALEHDTFWMATLAAVQRLLRPEGLFVLTCATGSRGEHGTNGSKPQDCPGLPWPDYYRNISEEDIRWRYAGMKGWADYLFTVQQDDLYLWAIKT